MHMVSKLLLRFDGIYNKRLTVAISRKWNHNILILCILYVCNICYFYDTCTLLETVNMLTIATRGIVLKHSRAAVPKLLLNGLGGNLII